MCSYIWFDKVFFFFESQFGLISITKESINQINIQLHLHLNINKFTIKLLRSSQTQIGKIHHELCNSTNWHLLVFTMETFKFQIQ